MKKSLINLAVIANLSIFLSACSGNSSESANQAPTFTSTERSFKLAEDTSLNGAFTATDADSDNFAFGVAKSPANGTLIVNRDGSFVYTPKAHFFGEDTASVIVSDSIATTTKDITFLVENINDAPIVISSHVVISEIGKAQGQVVADDYDEDKLTFSIITPPSKGTLTLDGSTGSFEYSIDTQSQIDDQFTVAVSDNHGAVTQAEILISPSFVTSDDKRNYYFNSSNSHLSQAINLIQSDQAGDKTVILDTTLSGTGYSDIAIGYAQSGYTDTAIELIENHIISRPIKAEAYRDVAVVLDEQSNISLANELREKSITEYNTYIAEVGLENISSSNAIFYLTVIRDYLDVDQYIQADKLLDTTRVYITSLSDLNVESTSAHRAFVGAYLAHAQNMTEDFLSDMNNATFDKAYQSIKGLSDIIPTVSFNETSRGIYHSHRANYYRQAAQLAHTLSLRAQDQNKQKAIELAKSNLAFGLALYSDISYDKDLLLKADQYAATTLARFDFPLQLFSGLFLSLYPDYVAQNKTAEHSGNVAYELIKQVGSSSDLRNTHRHLYAHTLLVEAQMGRDLDTILSQIDSIFAGGNEAEIFHTLIESSTINTAERYAAWLLHYSGYTENALSLIDEALQLVQSKAYQDDVKLLVSEVLESNGCLRLADLNTQFGGSDNRTENIIQTCADIVDKEYKGNDAVATTRKIQAFNVMTVAWANQQQADKSLAASLEAQKEAANISSFDDYVEEHFHIANTLATSGHLTQSQLVAQLAFDKLLSELAKEVEVAEKVEIIDEILKQLSLVTEKKKDMSYLNVYKLYYAVQHHAGTHSDYATVRESIAQSSAQVLSKVQQISQTLSENDKQDIYEVLITHYSSIGLYEEARTLALDSVYTEADKEQLLLTIVEHQATHDDFPASSIANVDTDKDGLVNFFLPGTTEQQISSSGLSLDDDSDNDGTPDLEDLMPLSAN